MHKMPVNTIEDVRHFAGFLGDAGVDVVWEAIQKGEASLYMDMGRGIIYEDRLFGPPVELLLLRYNDELGLHKTDMPYGYEPE